ncbi:GntR family transcriptional regulator [Neobacillus thermocopriae]|jgi:GntR family transcriptional regulator|uniref:GntR family transcriptional regulator n=1 Tax=Neobacillus thermocopriae TaxID=1215031 RepID=UPI002E1C43A7|nr:GntR family transcriptional regulator [Neobacillus thermocopriae]MED3713402.1 GntR family transcriptional regulator [Neobacillus thermocopriae]
MKLDHRSLYMQARDMIYDLIKKEYEPMQKIPSEQKLSEQLGVSRNTVREAIRTLEQEGILISRHGVGNFVIGSKETLKTSITTLESSTNIIKAHGYIPGTKKVMTDVIEANEEVSSQLLLEEDKSVFYIERVRTADGESVVYVEDYIPYQIGMELEYNSTYHESLLEFLEKFDHKVSFSICNLKAVISDEKVEKKLDLHEKSALLLLKQIHYSTAGIPVLYSDSYYLSDKFEFNVVRKRG